MPASLLPSSSRRSKPAPPALSEDFILRLAAKLFPAGLRPLPNVLLGVGDDAAVLRPLPHRTAPIFTIDSLACGTHFTPNDPPRAVAWKALAVNVSDIAAMGGLPAFALVSLGLPRHTTRSYVSALLRGLHRAAAALNLSILGGDSIRADTIVISVAMIGFAHPRHLCTRSGARPGHLVAVTGPLGGSLASGRHLRFSPRLQEAQWLVHHAKPSAMMDLSDGLALDASRLAAASNVSLHLQSHAIPRHRNASLSAALNDGEDFELLCTFPPRSLSPNLLRAYHQHFRKPLYLIGRVLAGPPVVCLDDKPLVPHAFEHFSPQS
ncbi:MAG: thiamine-phosphate kinase [bacterium]|nr:thiamine-phosphate kinase [bacterium]